MHVSLGSKSLIALCSVLFSHCTLGLVVFVALFEILKVVFFIKKCMQLLETLLQHEVSAVFCVSTD